MSKTQHQQAVETIMQAIDQCPVDVALEAGLTVMGKLAANIREANLASERSIMLAFTSAMQVAFYPADAPTPMIRLHHEQGTLQ